MRAATSQSIQSWENYELTAPWTCQIQVLSSPCAFSPNSLQDGKEYLFQAKDEVSLFLPCSLSLPVLGFMRQGLTLYAWFFLQSGFKLIPILLPKPSESGLTGICHHDKLMLPILMGSFSF